MPIVKSDVVMSRKDGKVLWPVVATYLVDVMHMLISRKDSAQNSFCYKPMLQNISVWLLGERVLWHVNKSVSSDIHYDPAIPFAITGAAIHMPLFNFRYSAMVMASNDDNWLSATTRAKMLPLIRFNPFGDFTAHNDP